MPLIYRNTKGSELTSDEVDGNFQFLDEEKQDNLTFDTTPTNGSSNPVTSDGVFEALETKAEESEVIKKDGSVSMEADLDLDGNSIQKVNTLTSISGVQSV